MSRRIDRLYDTALGKAVQAQRDLVSRMRVVKAEVEKTYPWWHSDHGSALQRAYAADAECCRLLQAAEVAWGVRDLRLGQLQAVKEAAS